MFIYLTQINRLVEFRGMARQLTPLAKTAKPIFLPQGILHLPGLAITCPGKPS